VSSRAGDRAKRGSACPGELCHGAVISGASGRSAGAIPEIRQSAIGTLRHTPPVLILKTIDFREKSPQNPDIKELTRKI